jgi:O-antigen ligase
MEYLVVVAAIAGAVWGLAIFSRGGLLAGCLAVLLAGICFGVDFFKLSLGGVPLTADRMLLVVLIGQYLIFRQKKLTDPKPLGKREILLIAFVALIVLSTFTADWMRSDLKPVSWLIIYYLSPFAVYWVARNSRVTERGELVMLGCLSAFGLYLALTSLAEYFEAWSLVFPKYIETSAAENKLEFIGRARGPLLNPIGNGMLLSVCLGATLMWWPRLGRPRQILLVLPAALMLAAIYCTMTRTVWMAGAFTLALVVGLSLPRSWRLPLLGGGLLAAVFATAFLWNDLMAFKRDRNLTAEQTAESVELRPILATVAWHMFLDHPAFGCGYCQYEIEHRNYVSDRSVDLPLEKGRGYRPHNVLFALLTETGAVGLCLFLAILCVWTRDAWLLWHSQGGPLWVRQQGMLFLVAMGVYVINGMFHDVSAIPMMHAMLFFMAGITEGLSAAPQTVSVTVEKPAMPPISWMNQFSPLFLRGIHLHRRMPPK